MAGCGAAHRLLENHVDLGQSLEHLERSGEAGRNADRLARAGLFVAAVLAVQAAAAFQHGEDLLLGRAEGDAPLARLAAPDAGAEFGPTEQEIFTVLEGRCRLHREDGSYEQAGPGQAIRIPPGFTGSFEVLARLTKVYVILK